ncbi:MAG: carboxypeptidase regulatory-like domain-containing protein [Ignisphaera sp.]
MNVEIDGIPLIRHVRDPNTGATKGLRSVYNIEVSEKRRIVEHKIPGFEGSILQDLGREPVTISFEGIIFGEGAREDLETIRLKFKAGSPVPFSSDISGVAEVNQVLIEDLQVEDSGGAVNRYRYRMVLREYIVPQEEEKRAPSQEEEAAEEVKEETNEALASVNYITGRVLDADGNPKSGVSVKITWEGGEYVVKTDEEGVFRKDNLEPGKYTITIDAPEYEGITREVEIESGGGGR